MGKHEKAATDLYPLDTYEILLFFLMCIEMSGSAQTVMIR